MQRTSDEPSYTFAEFLTHLDDTNSFVLGPDRGNSPQDDSFIRSLNLTNDYMHQRYRDPDEAVSKAARFCQIMHYISEHIDEFDYEDFAVKGSPAVGCLVGHQLFHAIFNIFADRDFWPEEADLDPAKVRTLAAELRDAP